MKIYFSHSASMSDIPAESPIEATLDTALALFRSLDLRKGFLGIVLDEYSTIQFLPQRGGIRIELLDTVRPAFDACVSEVGFVETLLHAAAQKHDVFAMAREKCSHWEHTDLA